MRGFFGLFNQYIDLSISKISPSAHIVCNALELSQPGSTFLSLLTPGLILLILIVWDKNRLRRIVRLYDDRLAFLENLVQYLTYPPSQVR